LKSGVHVTCKDGSTFGADILVGADGVHSTSRRAMLEFMPKRNPWFRGNIANKGFAS
jgi:2-polyprenyl-6-methoxyphenol hydroxylase-like FAD-dependent oxidoreductase